MESIRKTFKSIKGFFDRLGLIIALNLSIGAKINFVTEMAKVFTKEEHEEFRRIIEAETIELKNIKLF